MLFSEADWTPEAHRPAFADSSIDVTEQEEKRIMERLLRGSLSAALVMAVSVALAPSTAVAQEEGSEKQEKVVECTAEFTPTAVRPGQIATRVSVSLTRPIGTVKKLEAAEGSGVALATQEDLNMADLAREGDEEGSVPEPIVMSREANMVTVWLNTRDAEEGTYHVLLKGEEGKCAGEIAVKAPEEPEASEQQEGGGIR